MIGVAIDWPGLIILILGSSAATNALTAWLGRRRTTAEVEQVKAATANTATEAAERVVELMREQVDRQQAEIGDLRDRMSRMEQDAARDRERLRVAIRHIRRLEAHMLDHALTPFPLPPELEEL